MSEVTTVDPATGAAAGHLPRRRTSTAPSQVLGAVHAAQPAWAARPVEERAELVRAVGAQLRETGRRPRRADDRRDGQADRRGPRRGGEVGDRLRLLRRPRSRLPRPAPGRDRGPPGAAGWRTSRIGVVLAVMPWNFPYWQVLRFAAPTLLAGNTAILKHSPNVTGSALAIERVFRDAGLPENVFRSIVVAEADVPDGEPGADRGRPDRRGEPDRQRAGRSGRGCRGRPGHQEEPAGARRLRSVRRPGRRRPRRGGRRRGEEPVHQLGAELPGRQALRGARGGGRASSAGGSPPPWRGCAWAIRRRRRRRSDRWPGGPARRARAAGAGLRGGRRRPCSPAARRWRAPAPTSRRPC